MSGVFKSRPQTTTQTQTGKSESEQRGIFSGGQRKVMRDIGDAFLELIGAGPQVLESDRQASRAQINSTYAGLRPRLESAMTARGFGESGKLGAGFKDLEFQRAKAIQGGEADLRREALARYFQTLGMGSSFALHPLGQTSSGTTSGTSSVSVPGPSYFDRFMSGAGGLLGLGLMGGMPFPFFGGGGGGGARPPVTPSFPAFSPNYPINPPPF